VRKYSTVISGISGDVFVAEDGDLDISRQPSCLALEKRAIAQIIVIMLDQVEGITYRDSRGDVGAARRTVRSPQVPHNRLAVDREA
jgi:hypothetical protein